MRRRDTVRVASRSVGHLPWTGEHCPLSGWWMPSGSDDGVRFIAEGDLMPSYEGRPAVWAMQRAYASTVGSRL